MSTVHIVIIDNGDAEDELYAFDEGDQAQQFADVRGSCKDIQAIEVLDEWNAKALIDAEARLRAAEERADRWLAEH
jgi:hypothetical protein